MLTQTEADALITMNKTFMNPETISMPPGADQTHELLGEDKKERFLLDLWRGTIRLSKLKFQTRALTVIVLVRLDINGAPHTNPDGSRLGSTHLHRYQVGYEDKWAYPLDSKEFSASSNIPQTFRDFCRYCKIQNIPPFQEQLL